METTCNQILSLLDENGIDFKCHFHQPVFTMDEGAEVAKQLGISPCKCLLLVDRKKSFWLYISNGSDKTDLKTLAISVGSSRLSFAGEDDLHRLLHCQRGCVSALGLIFDVDKTVNVAINENVMLNECLAFHPCCNDATVVISTFDFFNIFLPLTAHNKFLTMRDKR